RFFPVADVELGLDLFGQPVLPPQEGRGRPEHRWTLENSNLVLLAFARRLSHADAASVIGIDAKTLRKHYSRECAMRATAELRLEMRQLARLNARAEKGNVGAERLLANLIASMRMRDQVKRVGSQERRRAEPVLGKKVVRKMSARTAAKDTPWDELLNPATGAAQPH
ncbi:MAG: hypothetical protein ACRDBL_11320, partial [Rhabdaerophilum sp.]